MRSIAARCQASQRGADTGGMSRQLAIATLLTCLHAGLYAPVATALELFGIDLATAERQQLRGAVLRAGAVLERQGGAQLFDRYGSAQLLDGSRSLYLGFAPDSGRFAFLEYELRPDHSAWMRDKLVAKYGEPQIKPGTFISDALHLWRVDGIEIRLQRDFDCFCSRLAYVAPEALTKLREQRRAGREDRRQRDLGRQSSAY